METKDIKLSIIIPFYNVQKYCDELLVRLNEQINSYVQVILVDDGSLQEYKPQYPWIEVYRKQNGGVSSARNYALQYVKGKYITYIDADDLVANNYISTILNKIDSSDFDYCYMSWKSFGHWSVSVKLYSVEDKFPSYNLCCWNRIYKFDLVKDLKFNENKLIAEDAEYIREAELRCKKKEFISDFMYLYRSDTPNSLTKRFSNGELNTKRIVYNYNHITKDMKNLIPEIKELNKTVEVIVMTNNNELPELEKYAMVTTPMLMKGTELRGENTNLFTKIFLPIKTQIILWTSVTFAIGGIETFIYNFCKYMSKYYDIIVLYDSMDQKQIERLNKIVQVEKNDYNNKYCCNTIIVNRITDNPPQNISYEQKIQMVHACKLMETWHVNNDNNYIVPVSSVVKETFKNEIDQNKCHVINNLTYINKPKKVLRLISCTRLTFEKGESRMIQLANMLNDNNIPFVWTIFSEKPLTTMPNGMVFMQPTLDVIDYIKDSDYLVQLSDSEGFCYSIVESMMAGTPVITTPIDVLDEIGFVDGETGFVVPFDMQNIDIQKIYKSKLKFKYNNNNNLIINQWKDLLGDAVPTHNYVYTPQINTMIKIQVLAVYHDVQLNRMVKRNEILTVTEERAQQIVNAGLAKIIR